MVQGGKKMAMRASGKKNTMSAKVANKLAKAKAKTKKGNPSACGTRLRQRSAGALMKEDAVLSKAIAVSSEGKVAAKLLQAGKTLSKVKDALMKGKELNKEKRREQVKKKVGRTEENYLKAKAKAELRDQ
jgi:hypothetical protein